MSMIITAVFITNCMLWEQEQTSLQHLCLAFLNHSSGFSHSQCWVPKATHQVAWLCHWEKDATLPVRWSVIWLERIFSWAFTTTFLSPDLFSLLPSSASITHWVHRYLLLIGTLTLGLSNPCLSFLQRALSFSESCWQGQAPNSDYCLQRQTSLACYIPLRIREERDICTYLLCLLILCSSTSICLKTLTPNMHAHIQPSFLKPPLFLEAMTKWFSALPPASLTVHSQSLLWAPVSHPYERSSKFYFFCLWVLCFFQGSWSP